MADRKESSLSRARPPARIGSLLITPAVFLLSVHSACSAIGDAPTIRALTADVTVILKGSATPQSAYVGMQLPKESELKGLTKDSSVQIECSNKATQTLSGYFDALIDSADAKTGCTVDLLAGTAVATTGINDASDVPSGGAEIVGTITMASRHTQFGLAIPEGDAEGFVFDGDATLRVPGSQSEVPVSSGAAISGNTRVISPIDSERYKGVAVVYARLDISQSSVNTEVADEAHLRDRWLSVLRKPSDPLARVELVEAQAKIGATKSMVFRYELQRALAIATESGKPELKNRAKDLGAQFGVQAPVVRPNPPSNVSVR